MRWGMAAKCRKHGHMHAFSKFEEEAMPIDALAMFGAVALKCHKCAEFEQDEKAKAGTKRCAHMLVAYMKIEGKDD